ncbi:MAG: CDP-alcohol phosphatidyltransferase family protein [Dictyoglomus thermophilum]|nr:CDP-alcohol phosphatidyltransferase family protein [Dictyoglomus thermophilum]
MIMTLPNIITLIRLAIIPFYTYFLLTNDLFIAAILYGVAAISDILDGYLARRLNQTSNLGKIIDPLADKIIVIISLIYLGLKAIFPLWGVLILFIKELIMLLVGFFFLIRGVEIISSRIYGKLAMVLISISILMALLNISFSSVVFLIGLVLSLMAGMDYLLYYLRSLKTNKS